ncbi:Transcription factor Adf-1 [Dissostichus eleginoides]|uniref:Transcription factor Adf-1 n=1 Tax=Dissostichus eleginoides TaxID=100907 RepID=A0AAD9F0X5_DISEL|nr:Transcription factor Adf-1 [Dissostichus eleginoides]
MEHKLIVAVSGFPSLYDSGSLTYRDLNMRAESWRQVSQIVGVPESECRRKWKTLRDQHRRERQREKERYSAILSFLNPFIDARAAGTNGWALDPQPSMFSSSETGCSTTTETRSDDDEHYDISVGDATTTTTSSPSSEFVQRKRPSSDTGDDFRFKEAKMEGGAEKNDCAQTQQQQHDNMKELFEMMMHSVSSLAASIASSHPSSSSSSSLDQPTLNHHLKTENQEAELLVLSDDEEEEDHPRVKRRGEALLEDHLRRTEAREAQKDDVTLFLLSLAPALRRLTPQKQSWVRTKIQQFLHEAEFGATSFQ